MHRTFLVNTFYVRLRGLLSLLLLWIKFSTLELGKAGCERNC